MPRKGSRIPIATRFWPKVAKSEDGCWLWMGAKTKARGYGFFGSGGRGGQVVLAHRVSWELTHGPVPEGMYVCHHCDNTSCVRPDHLFLGNQKDNMQDMYRKGRQPIDRNLKYGEERAQSKLTNDAVRAIRRLPKGVYSQRELGDVFGVSQGVIGHILLGKTYKCVEVS